MMLFLVKCLLYDALLFVECSFLNNMTRNFLSLCKNINVNKSGKKTSLHKSNYALFFSFDSMQSIGWFACWSFILLHHLYILTLVIENRDAVLLLLFTTIASVIDDNHYYYLSLHYFIIDKSNTAALMLTEVLTE
jgi:hypothetical protein